jgi:predicted ATPase
MLVEFNVRNYKSFKDTATLSLAATRLVSRDRELDDDTVFAVDADLKLLTGAAIYGANAGGKSNLAHAIIFMRTFVLNSSKETQAGDKIPIEPFALSPDTRQQPSEFEIIFIAEGTQYRYGFEVDAARVTREWLYHVPNKKETRLFDRTGQDIILAPLAFKEGRGLESKTRENALFVSVVAQFNGEISRRILTWFSSCGVISGLVDVALRAYTTECLKHPGDAEKILAFVRSLDVGIEGLRLEAGKSVEVSADMPAELKALLQRSEPTPAIKTAHRTFVGDEQTEATIYFDLDTQESEGTRKIVALAGPILNTLHTGKVLIIDEFDARFHPLISREIVRLFNSRQSNPKHAQLLFLTHDTNLLDRTLLRRDQIWFVEKDRFGASHLYSLAEFKVRNDATFEKDYVRGKYGAIPFLGDLQRVMEDAHD